VNSPSVALAALEEHDFHRVSHLLHQPPIQLPRTDSFHLPPPQPPYHHQEIGIITTNANALISSVIHANMAPKSTVEKVSDCHASQGANTTDNLTQDAKKDSDPRINWTKEMTFMLALAAEHQKKTSLGGGESTNWNAVLEVMNEMWKRSHDFGLEYPEGLGTSDRLRSQYHERHRPHKLHSTKHRKPSWALEPSLCTVDERRDFPSLADAVIQAETFLRNTPGSIVLHPGPNAERWPQYDVRAPVPRTTQGTKRSGEPSKDIQPDAPVKAATRRRAAKKATDEEEDEQDEWDDGTCRSSLPVPYLGRRSATETPAESYRRHLVDAEVALGSDAQPDAPVKTRRLRKAAKKPIVEGEEEDRTEDHRKSSSPAPTASLGRRRANETRAEANLQHAAAAKSVRGGARVAQDIADGSFSDEDEGEDGDGHNLSTLPGQTNDLTSQDGSVSLTMTTRNGDGFLGPANYSITIAEVNAQPTSRRVHHRAINSEAFDAILSILNNGTVLAMIHTSHMSFLPYGPVVVTRTTRPSAPVNAATDLSYNLDMFVYQQPVDEDEAPTVIYCGVQNIEIENSFVQRTSLVHTLGGRACRIVFCDEVSQHSKIADVVLCTASTCGSCCVGELSPVAEMAGGQDVTRAMVFEKDLQEVEGHGWLYSPADIQFRFNESFRRTGQVVQVSSSGCFIEAEIVEEAEDLSDPHFFDSDQ
jgi:hypothetical protein